MGLTSRFHRLLIGRQEPVYFLGVCARWISRTYALKLWSIRRRFGADVRQTNFARFGLLARE